MDDDESVKITDTWSYQQGDGYPSLADCAARDPDHETYVFRKFKRLAVRNILHLQGELIKLEKDVEILECEAVTNFSPGVHQSMRSWAVADGKDRADGSYECRRQELARNLEGKLKSYCQYTALMKSE